MTGKAGGGGGGPLKTFEQRLSRSEGDQKTGRGEARVKAPRRQRARRNREGQDGRSREVRRGGRRGGQKARWGHRGRAMCLVLRLAGSLWKVLNTARQGCGLMKASEGSVWLLGDKTGHEEAKGG